MPPRNHLAEAQRWAKFPATALLATGVLWLLESYFGLDWASIGKLTRTGIGAVAVFTNMVVIPLGSMVVGVGLLLTQRWALWTAFFLPLLPLLILSGEKWLRISEKFSQFHSSGDAAHFGDGVMTALLISGLWVVYALLVMYLHKSLAHLNIAGGRIALRDAKAVQTDGPPDEQPREELPCDDEVCLLMPDSEMEEDL